MKLTCNIDRRGRRIRLWSGIVVAGAGGIGIVFGVLTGKTAPILGGAIVALAGGFMIFEAAVGWCAARALGFKTKW